MDGCTVSWEGDHGGTYYVPCDRVQYLNSELINTSNTSFNGYSTITSSNNSPYVVFPSNGYPYYYESYSNRDYIEVAQNVTFNAKSHYYKEFDIVLIVALGIIAVGNLVKIWR